MQGHTWYTLGEAKPPHLVQIICTRTLSIPLISHSPSLTLNVFMTHLLYTIQGPAACLTITSQTSSNPRFGKYSHKIQHWAGAQHLPSSDPLSPTLPSITDILEGLTSIWQCWRLTECYCSQEYHRGFSAFPRCQIKPAVFMMALWESQVLATLHKWTKIAEDPRVPASKLQFSSEETVIFPPYAHTLKWKWVRIVTSHWQPH